MEGLADWLISAGESLVQLEMTDKHRLHQCDSQLCSPSISFPHDGEVPAYATTPSVPLRLLLK